MSGRGLENPQDEISEGIGVSGSLKVGADYAPISIATISPKTSLKGITFHNISTYISHSLFE